MSKDKNFAIFRRFDELNMLHLMALQAEILELRELFRDRCRRDDQDNSGSGQEPRMYSKYFHALRESDMTQPPSPETVRKKPPSSQLGLMTALRQRMAEYNALLLQVSQLALIPEPKKSQLSELQGWLRDPKGGKNFLKRFEFWTWRDNDASSYVTMNPPISEGDTFTSFITYRMASIFDRLLGRRFQAGKIVDEEAGLRSYSDSKLGKASNVIAAIVASTLPVLTIFVLNSVNSTTARIGWTVLFTAVFAGILALFSSAKRAELFAATAT
ncbi:hypothetical protein C8A00DRAFT_34536 [Chaetomidium leptoderma]|uniref:DUF6594 domain-containing protein n=1 Tax=Chaetomidium leptoderma TaxID=669021 RepID=A0AAN6ZWD8_9PEZI|nr:hypothetical protein C8A00DRAFT_34536 [Chaetomidium leptoderma]